MGRANSVAVPVRLARVWKLLPIRRRVRTPPPSATTPCASPASLSRASSSLYLVTHSSPLIPLCHSPLRAAGASASCPLPYTDLRGTPMPAPLHCHSVGTRTSVPTGNTGACRQTECASRREPVTAGTWRRTTARNESTGVTKQLKNFQQWCL